MTKLKGTGKKNKPRPDRKVERIKEGEARATRWNALTPQQKLNELDQRLGKSIGAIKQRRRHQKELKKASS